MEKEDDTQIFSIRFGMPAEVRPLFGRVPVLTSESKLGYWLIVECFRDAVCPRDVIEWMIVRNLVDLTWNILFFRRVGPGIIDVARMDAVISILKSILPNPSAQDVRTLAQGWFTRNSEASSMITDLFVEHQINVSHVDAEAVRLRLQTVEQIERMLASLESRFRLAYRDLYFHREVLRMSAEIGDNSAAKPVPVIPAGELSDPAPAPEQDGLSDDKGSKKDLATDEPASE
jgi:hypothetical protein